MSSIAVSFLRLRHSSHVQHATDQHAYVNLSKTTGCSQLATHDPNACKSASDCGELPQAEVLLTSKTRNIPSMHVEIMRPAGHAHLATNSSQTD
jgi:hypothetical protein